MHGCGWVVGEENSLVAGKWLDAVLKENVPRVLPKMLWWIPEMIKMPETYVVHLGNSKEVMDVAEDNGAKTVLREHVRESLGVTNEDSLCSHKQYAFTCRMPVIHLYSLAVDLHISVSRGKGQDLFLRAFYESIQLIQEQKVQGTSAGCTAEIVVHGSTGLLHPIGKEGVTPLAKSIVKLATHVERRLTMGKRGYERVKSMFLERHMAHRIDAVLREVLRKA
ncbi:hypothetical protein RHSIM_Rhsim08G0122700 [Rhododendron simsii]|uniref:Uncharacterized protein n=1 Tax=Rhododendron simsii TaxID=118357 RepID=A0A834LGP8_RHOSS|nr:hypothetical protein RHSIM_Rhsim08G0122700 [Rhododendron simsii]